MNIESTVKTEVKSTFTFTKKQIEAAIISDLEKKGQKVLSKTWNEQNTKFEVQTTERKGK